MGNYGFARLAAAVPPLVLADCKKNAEHHLRCAKSASGQGAQLLVFPELSLSGATCQDLFAQPALVKGALSALQSFLKASAAEETVCLLGLPLDIGGKLYSAACAVQKGVVLGVVPNPAPKEACFAKASPGLRGEIELCGKPVPYGTDLVFRSAEFSFTVGFLSQLTDPGQDIAKQAGKGEVLAILGAMPELAGDFEAFQNALCAQSRLFRRSLVFASSGFGESSTDNCFAGRAFITEGKRLLARRAQFSLEEELILSDADCEFLLRERPREEALAENLVNFSAEKTFKPEPQFPAKPFVPEDPAARAVRCKEVFEIQSLGLLRRLQQTGSRSAVLGVSGGLDSTLALFVIRRAFELGGLDPRNIRGITMPCFGTTKRTRSNAEKLMKELGISFGKINIEKAIRQHFQDIGHDINDRSAAYENAQARERTQILMDIANKCGGIVVGTGDLSEAALGWATYNGDQMSMYNVNCGVPKTLVRAVTDWLAEKEGGKIRKILKDILDTPVSPELLPGEKKGKNQETEKLIGPYELHDFFLYHMIRRGASPGKLLFLAEKTFKGKYPKTEIKKYLSLFLKRFLTQQFKRSASPDGVGTGSVSLSPRAGFRIPSDVSFALWLEDLS
ncbi:NAD(+) synthase [bacterium]|nr:NAD(+) synthase [bacterium]